MISYSQEKQASFLFFFTESWRSSCNIKAEKLKTNLNKRLAGAIIFWQSLASVVSNGDNQLEDCEPELERTTKMTSI